jgi:parallel beta-helix repeat protein
MVLLLLGVFISVRVSRADETMMSVTPTQITVAPTQFFTINVTVNAVNNMTSWQVALKYNATVINCTAAWIPQSNVFANQQTICVAPVLNEPTVDGYNYSLYGSTLFSGSVNVMQGILCGFNFTCQAYGITPLQLGTAANPIEAGSIYFPTKLYSKLLDPDGNEISFAEQDGLVTNGLQPMLTIISVPDGTTSPQPGNYSCMYGGNVSVTAIPSTGYILNNWLLDNSNVGSANPLTILMTSNHTVQPVFTQANYTLTIVGAVGGNTSLLPGTYNYPAGQVVNVSATVDAGYVFSYWILDGSEAGSANPLPVVMDGNHTLAPIFSSAGYVYVYIRADGSIDPAGVPILTSDNITYQLAGNLGSMITVQRSNVLIDGNGHTLQGGGSGEGIRLIGVNNVSVTNVNIRGFDDGIDLLETSQDLISENNITADGGLGISLYGSCNSTICRNNIIADSEGIHLDYSSNYNSIFGNNVEDNNYVGIYIDSSCYNLLYHNNMVNNTNQVYVAANGYSPINSWDNGMEGNYWSNYVGVDSDLNGIGDTPYVIDANNTDHFPLMGLFSSFSISQGYSVNIFSNSTITDFNCSSSDRKISFNVAGENGTTGFCELTIPHTLMDVNRIEVVIDNGSTPVLYSNLDLRDNTAYRWIYFSYQHSTHTIIVQEDWTPPTIVVLSPENQTYAVNQVLLSFTVSKQTSWEGYSLDGSVNVTIIGNQTLNNIPDGLHSIIVYSNDTAGNMGFSKTVFFTIDTTPPSITRVQQNPPENEVLSDEIVVVSATVFDNASGVKSVNLNYTSANGSATIANVLSMTNVQGNIWNATIPGFPFGTNVTYTIIAEDNAGNTITTQEIGLNYQYEVMPEYSALFILPLLMVGSLLMMILAKRQNRRRKMQVQQT